MMRHIKRFIAIILVVFGSASAFGTDRDVVAGHLKNLELQNEIQEYKTGLTEMNTARLWGEVGMQFSAIMGYCSASLVINFFGSLSLPFAGVVDLFVMSKNALSGETTEPEIYAEPFTAFREANQRLDQDLITPFLGETSRCQKAGYKLDAVSEEFDRRGIHLTTEQMVY